MLPTQPPTGGGTNALGGGNDPNGGDADQESDDFDESSLNSNALDNGEPEDPE